MKAMQISMNLQIPFTKNGNALLVQKVKIRMNHDTSELFVYFNGALCVQSTLLNKSQ